MAGYLCTIRDGSRNSYPLDRNVLSKLLRTISLQRFK